MHYFIDSQSKIDIKDLLNEFIDQYSHFEYIRFK